MPPIRRETGNHGSTARIDPLGVSSGNRQAPPPHKRSSSQSKSSESQQPPASPGGAPSMHSHPQQISDIPSPVPTNLSTSIFVDRQAPPALIHPFPGPHSPTPVLAPICASRQETSIVPGTAHRNPLMLFSNSPRALEAEVPAVLEPKTSTSMDSGLPAFHRCGSNMGSTAREIPVTASSPAARPPWRLVPPFSEPQSCALWKAQADFNSLSMGTFQHPPWAVQHPTAIQQSSSAAWQFYALQQPTVVELPHHPHDTLISQPWSSLHHCFTLNGLILLHAGSPVPDAKVFYICVHGWAGSSSDYEYLFKGLRKLHATTQEDVAYIAIDFCRVNYSPQQAGFIRPDVDALAALVNEIKNSMITPAVGGSSSTNQRATLAPKIILVGHSTHCRVVIRAWNYANHETPIFGIVLIEGTWHLHRLWNYDPQTIDPEVARFAPQRAEATQVQSVKEAFPSIFGPNTPEAFQKSTLWNLNRLRMDTVFWDQLWRSFRTYDKEMRDSDLRKIGGSGTKVLMIGGSVWMREDLAFSRSVGDTVRGRNGGDILGMGFAGCGHWPHVDMSQDVADLIVKWEMGLILESRGEHGYPS